MDAAPAAALASPPPLATEEFMLFDDNFADQFLNSIDDAEIKPSCPATTTTTTTTTTTADDILMELEQEIKSEPYWLTAAAPEPPSVGMLVDESSPKNTEELLFEFDAVCSAVGVTPPASPPAKLLEGAPIYYVVQGEEIDAELLLNGSISESEESNDFLDELVRSHSSSIPDDVSDTSSLGSTSPAQSSPARSDSSFDVSGFDEEWTPASPESSPPKRKKRPYGRPVEEKKVRKKEQNKNAATRYRQKKKQQLEVVLREEDELKAVHMQLKTQFEDTKREISYLKKLMREILAAKGVQI